VIDSSQYWLYRHDISFNEEPAQGVSSVPDTSLAIKDGIAVIDVRGPITTYPSFFGVSASALKSSIFLAMNSPKVSAILLNIDSPGSAAVGATDFSDWLKQATKIKKIYSYCLQACSGALLLAAATNKIYANDMSVLGSVGVIYRGRLEKEEIIIRSRNAPLKSADGSSEDGKNAILTFLNELEDIFINRLSIYRGISAEEIIKKWGQGNILTAKKAASVGMVDEILSFDNTFNEIRKNIVSEAEKVEPQMKRAQIEEMMRVALLEQSNKQTIEMQDALIALEKKHTDEKAEIMSQIEADKQKEESRKTSIEILFSMFDRETQYAAQYASLKAKCMADQKIDSEIASQQIISLQGTFSVAPQILAQSPTPVDLATNASKLDAIVAEIMRKEPTKSRSAATLEAIEQSPEAHVTYVNALNNGADIRWE